MQVRKKVGQKEASAVYFWTELGHFFASPLLTSPDINLSVWSALPEAQPAPRVHSSSKCNYNHSG